MLWTTKSSYRRSVCLNVFLCLTFLSSGTEAISEQCKEYLQYVASSNSQFEVCAFLRARPFTVCTGCFKDYAFAYNTIINLKNGRGRVEKNCSEDLVSGDRVSIVNRAFDYLTDTWGSGNCDNCLVVHKTNDQLSFDVAETTKEFQQKSEQLTTCIDLHLRNQSEVCAACKPAYTNLSDFYNQLVKKHKSRICMDILDVMNQTRVDWAVYGCSRTYGLDAELCLYMSVVPIITIMFYLYVRLSQHPKDAEIIEGRTMRHHMSKISINSNASRLDSDYQHKRSSGRLRPLQSVIS